MVLLVLLLLIWPVDGFSQQKAAKKPVPRKTAAPATLPTRWPIETLTVEGSKNYSAEQILAVAGLKRGQLAGKAEFEAARDRLVATGAFETVGYRFEPAPNSNGYAASFQVTDVEPVYPVRFEELDVADKDLTAWLKAKDPLFGPKIASTVPVLGRYVSLVEQYLASRNRKGKIISKLFPVSADQFTIVFRPARSAPAVAQVSFEGIQAVPANLLRDAISGVAVGTPYSEDRFRQLLDTSVRPLYDARGHIRVTFPKIATEPASDVQGLHVTVSVEEGPVYDLGNVQLQGDTAVKPADLLKAGKFKPGEPANFDAIAQGVDEIKRQLRRHGYMRADARLERAPDDRKKTVDVMIHIEQGPQFVFGKLSIEGLDLNGEAAIKRLWAMKEGKPFNGDYPDYFLNRVREDNLFEDLGKTRSAIQVDEQSRIVNVTLYFR